MSVMARCATCGNVNALEPTWQVSLCNLCGASMRNPTVKRIKLPTSAEIDLNIRTIMREDGPDGHTDGSEIITAYIIALLMGKGEEWMVKRYGQD
jgi:hypothetical protein